MRKITTAKQLRVVFLDFDDIQNPLLAGGQARATYEISKRLVKAGHKVTIICSRFPGYKDRVQDGIRYRHIGLGSNNIRLNSAIFFLALPFAVRKLKVAVIVECFNAPISTCFSPLFTHTPVIGLPAIFEAEEFAKKYHLPFHWVERIGCRLYKYFIAYSIYERDKMLRLNPGVRWKIIPNGVDGSYVKIKESTGDYIIYLGRIDIFQKGLDLLLDALETIKDKLGLKVILAGSGQAGDIARLHRLIHEKELSEIVRFIGRVDGQQKEDLIKRAAFGVVPSRFETFALVPIELISFAKPLVCFDIGGLTWISNKVALKVEPFLTTEFGQAIEKLAVKRDLLQALKRNCRRFAAQFTWDKIAQEYAKFFAEVISIESTAKEGSKRDYPA